MKKNSEAHLNKHLERLTALAISLCAEKDYSQLLETILTGARELTGADGGTLYTLSEDRRLHFALAQTESLGIRLCAHRGEGPFLPPIPLYSAEGEENRSLVVTRAFFENRTINIPDTYATTGFDFSGTHAFDVRTGYRSRSMLAIPLMDHQEKIIGVMQLINARDTDQGDIIPFGTEDEHLSRALASLAATLMTKKRLIEGLENLLQSLVRVIATAIDDKSPTTGEHCRRVPVLTTLLAEAINKTSEENGQPPPLSPKERYELDLAAWLHDCGKLSIPEYIVAKKTKLETVFDRIHLIDTRLEILRRDIEIDYLNGCLSAVQSNQGESLEKLTRFRDRELKYLDSLSAFLAACNLGTEFMSEETRLKISELASLRTRPHGGGTSIPLLTEEEIANLCISRGTLTSKERELIDGHILSTRRMLEALPFPEHLKRVPHIAGSHHERMNGSGYPEGLTAEHLTLQTRILALADIFEALTSSGRLYRTPNSLSEALGIMKKMCDDGLLDADLFRIFVQKKVYLRFAQGHLPPDQIDTTDFDLHSHPA